MRRATPLDDVNPDLPIDAKGGKDAQWRGRRLVLCCRRPKQERWPLAGLSANLQPPDLLGPCLRQPGDERATRSRLHELLRAPKALGRGLCLNPDQVFFVDAGMVQTGQMGSLRRPDHHHVAAAADDVPQRGPNEAPLEDRLLWAQHLGQRLARPATAGQFGIQGGESAGDDGATLAAEVKAAPKRLLNLRWQFTRL